MSILSYKSVGMERVRNIIEILSGKYYWYPQNAKQFLVY